MYNCTAMIYVRIVKHQSKVSFVESVVFIRSEVRFLRDELLLALFAGRVLVVFGARHGDLSRVALLVQELLEGIQLVALV